MCPKVSIFLESSRGTWESRMAEAKGTRKRLGENGARSLPVYLR